VIELRGYHLHNELPNKNIGVGDESERFVTNTFLKNLETGKVMLPDGSKDELIEVPIADLGIKFPVLVTNVRTQVVTYMAEPIEGAAGAGAAIGPGGPEGMPMQPGATGTAGEQLPKTFKLRQYDFIVQFCWQPQPRGARQKIMAEKKNTTPSTAAVGTEAPAGPSS
jgi:hypothetical protein